MDILSGFNTSRRATVITRAIGDFMLDCVTVESHASTLRLTENPVESGANIADHAVLEPKEITVAGVMVGYSPPQNFKNLTGYDTSFYDDYPLPIEIAAHTRQAEAMANQFFSRSESATKQAGRVLAPWYPEAAGLGKDVSPTLDRVGKAYEDLLRLQKNGETITIQTGIRQYRNMVLISVSVVQMYDGSAEFSLVCREVFIVESKQAQGIHPDVKASSPTKKNLGKTQPKQVNRSAIKSGVSLFGR